MCNTTIPAISKFKLSNLEGSECNKYFGNNLE